ncbi:D-mannonate oxidoreductase [Klebsiella pneumoniae]|uniref:D-mannonate oxidoreductase n=1 Tax=Klebsiella pneumoniae TaxID=573 RepID=A0A377X873_KLEPN|nr:D-mannonate oxidoreductase [Klebsiella pneumoniae]
MKQALHAGVDGLEAVLAAMCQPQVAIVSLTITEKGYCHSPASGELQLDHPLIAADLHNPHQPKIGGGGSGGGLISPPGGRPACFYRDVLR